MQLSVDHMYMEACVPDKQHTVAACKLFSRVQRTCWAEAECALVREATALSCADAQSFRC